MHEEPGWIELIAGLRTEDGRAPNESIVHLGESVTVGSVEAARKSTHHFETRLLGCGVDDGL